MPKRAAKKSARKSAPGRPFAAGSDTRRAKGPAKGAPNAGRPPDEFKAMCAALASRAATLDAVTAILSDPTHSQFMAALKWATDRGYGQAVQAHEHTGADGNAIAHAVTVSFVGPTSDQSVR